MQPIGEERFAKLLARDEARALFAVVRHEHAVESGRVKELEDPRIAIAVAVEGDPRHAVELRQTCQMLLGALDRVSPVLRSTVVLTTLQGLSCREAAVVLDTNEGMVAWRVHEARNQLRKHVAEAMTPLDVPEQSGRRPWLADLAARA